MLLNVAYTQYIDYMLLKERIEIERKASDKKVTVVIRDFDDTIIKFKGFEEYQKSVMLQSKYKVQESKQNTVNIYKMDDDKKIESNVFEK